MRILLALCALCFSGCLGSTATTPLTSKAVVRLERSLGIGFNWLDSFLEQLQPKTVEPSK